MRIAIGGFQHETNTFSETATTWHHFATADTWPGLLDGPALLSEFAPVPGKLPRNIPIAGFIDAASHAPYTLIPTTWCAAGPSGRVTEDAFERILAELVHRITAARPDAVYLDLHGAMAADHIDDADGEILHRVRQAIGETIPLVASLDMHANVSPRMIEQADMLLAYRTYPHIDMAATGAQAFAWLSKRLNGLPRPPVAWQRIPYLVPMCWQSTDTAPASHLYETLGVLEQRSPVTLSLAMGFPAADVEKCGPSAWAYATTSSEATQACQHMMDAMMSAEHAFAGELLDAEAAVAHAMTGASATTGNGPVIIADAQDNPGAGGSADTTTLLKTLVAHNAGHSHKVALGLFVDPDVASQAHAAGIGAHMTVRLGGKAGIPGDTPFETACIVEALHEGQVQATGKVFNGYQLALGKSACLNVAGIRVVVVSRAVQLLDLALLRFIGIEPTAQDIIVVKSTVHFRADFAPIASEIVVCKAPGAFLLDPVELPWTKLPPTIRRRAGQNI